MLYPSTSLTANEWHLVQRRVAAERLGIDTPYEIASGHCVNLSRPDALATLLARMADDGVGPTVG